MFGPYAALKLAELSEGVVLDCLSQLDECLARWKELLDPVTMAVVVSTAGFAGCAGCALTVAGYVKLATAVLGHCTAC